MLGRRLSEHEAFDVLAWRRRRSLWNQLRQLLRRRALQLLLGVYVSLAVFGLLEEWSVLTGPIPALAPSAARATGADTLFIFIALYSAFFLGALSYKSLFLDSITEVDLVHTAPFSGRTIVRERLRHTLVVIAGASLCLGLLLGDVLGHSFGISPVISGFELSGVLFLVIWLTLVASVSIGLQVARLGDHWGSTLAAGCVLGLLTLVFVSFGTATGVLTDPILKGVGAFGIWATESFMNAPFGLPWGPLHASFILVVATVTVLLSIQLFSRDYQLYQPDTQTGAGLGLTIERAPRHGFWARLRVALRSRYRDLGERDEAVRGLVSTLVYRSGGIWTGLLVGGLFTGFGILILQSAAASGSFPPPYDPASRQVVPFFSLLLLLTSLPIAVPVASPIAVELWRLIPFSPKVILRSVLRTALPFVAWAAVGLGLLAAAFGVPLVSAGLLGSVSILMGLTLLLSGLRGGWSSQGLPTDVGGGTNASPGPTPPAGGTFGVLLFNLFALFFIFSLPGVENLDFGLGVLVAADVVLFAFLWRSTERAAL